MNVRNCIEEMREGLLSLFPRKECYLLEHTSNGKNILFSMLPESLQRQLRCDNMHIATKLKYTYKNGFPILAPYNPTDTDIELHSYSKRKSHQSNRSWAVHFFQHDYTFFRAITVNLEKTTHALYDCDMIFAPDCSLYVDAPEFINKLNIYRSRFAAAYWQYCGYNVIQTASWGDANSLKYAFEGLAEHSATAVCGIGHNHCEAAKQLWIYAVKKLVEQKMPTKLFVYGGRQDELPDLGIPVVYIEDYINKHFRNNK